MSKLTLICSALVLALCATQAQAQMPDPVIQEGMYSYYDLSGLKGGEWIEYETTSEMVMQGVPPNPTKTSSKMACVGVEGDTVYLESDQMLSYNPGWKGMTIMCAVDKKTGNITKAWWGKVGEAGKELKVEKAAGGKPAEAPKFDGSGTAKVSKESIKVAGADYDCEKIEMDITTKANGMESKMKTTSWTSEKVAFKYKAQAADAKDPYDGKVKWEGKAEGKGGLVKSTSDMAGTGYTMKTTMEIKASGTDAKMSLKK